MLEAVKCKQEFGYSLNLLESFALSSSSSAVAIRNSGNIARKRLIGGWLRDPGL